MSYPNNPKTILVIDDDLSTLDLLRSVLLKGGYKVVTASESEQAFDYLKNNTADLILLDIMMPEMDGYQLCMYLKNREETENIPVIFITALSDPKSIIKSFAAGAVDYITKPFNTAELLARINVYIHLPKTHSELFAHKKSVQVCSDCSDVWDNKLWMTAPEYLSQYSGVVIDEAVCPDCKTKEHNSSADSNVPGGEQLLNAQPATILLIDDYPENIQLLGKILAQKDYKVIVANSGREALKYLENKQPDLILLDIMMPEMDGYEVCSKIKRNPLTKDIPVIFLTALAETDAILKGFKLGANDFITKPFDLGEVLARVQAQIEFRHLHEILHKQKSRITVCEKCQNIKLNEEVWVSFEKMYGLFGPSILAYTICPQCTEKKYLRR